MIILLAILSGVCYRLGGWIQTKIRDFGCPTIATIALWLLGIHNPLLLLIHFGLLFASLTTYWKIEGNDARWWNWALTGLGYSLALIPICIGIGHWHGFIIRTLVLVLGTVAVSEMSDNVWVEEIGRGALLILTLPLLWI